MPAGDVTKTLYASLGIRLEDAAAVTFTNAVKLDVLNRAQNQLTDLLHDGYFSGLEVVDTTKALTSGALAFTAMSALPIRGREGIKAVKFNPVGGGTVKWAVEIDLADIKKQENSLLTCTDAQPGYFIFNSKINPLATTLTGATLDVYFLKIPTDMSDSVDPIISASLFPVLLLLAEAMCWSSDAKLDRAGKALDTALVEIKTLNERYTAPKGTGTQNRK